MSFKAIGFALVAFLIGLPIYWLYKLLHAPFIAELGRSVLGYAAVWILVLTMVFVVFVPAIHQWHTGAWSLKFWKWPPLGSGLVYVASSVGALCILILCMLYFVSEFPEYPPGFLLHMSALISGAAFILFASLGAQWVASRVTLAFGNCLTNNNWRFWTLALIFANLVLVCIALPPTSAITLAGAKQAANDAWGNQTLRDAVGFFLFGNKGLGHSADPLFTVEKTLSIGWWHILLTAFVGLCTMIYFPVAYRDEVVDWVNRLREKKRISTETSEAKPIPGQGSKGGILGLIQNFLGYSAVDLFWESALFLLGKIGR